MTLPPDPFFDKSSCPIWSCDIEEVHTHDNDDSRLPLNKEEKEELIRLRRWKAEALMMLAEWELVWEALGKPGPLGESKATASLDKITGKGEE